MKILKTITASTTLPKQGIFWVIKGKLLNFADTINPQDFVEFGALNHKDTWRHIKSEYLVDNKPVEYDYFPRGRVIVCPTFDDDNHITGYDCGIYADSCIIDDPDVRVQIINDFDLYHKSCNVLFEGDYSTDNTHYTCHNCRKPKE